MEEETTIEEKEGNAFLGILLAILGGIIATAPWVILYVYGNMIYSALALIIALGAFYGYKISKAKIDKKVPVIIAIISLACVTLATLLVIPMLLLAKKGIYVSLENFKNLYQMEEFRSAILKDYVVSLIFTVLGISGIIANLNRQIRNGVSSKEIKAIQNDIPVNEETTKKIKEMFVRYNAMDEIHAVDKKDILNELEENDKDIMFGYLINRGIIKRKKGKFYYSEEGEKNPKDIKKTTTIRTVVIALGIVIIVVGMSIIMGAERNNNNYTNQNVVEISESNLKIALPRNFTLVTAEEIDSAYGQGASEYYEFIASDYNTSNIFCYKINENELKEQYKKELKKELKDISEYIEILFNDVKDKVKIENKQISKYNCTIGRYEYTFENREWIEEFVMYNENGNYICLDLSYPKDQAIDLNNILR